MVISSEYSTGGIRSTFTAVPRRTRVVIGKAVVLGLSTLVVGLVASFVAFFVGQLILATKHFEVGLGDPDVLRAVSAAALPRRVLAVRSRHRVDRAQHRRRRHGLGGRAVRAAAAHHAHPRHGRRRDPEVRHVQRRPDGRRHRLSPDRLGPWVGYLVFTVWWLVLVGVGTWLVRRRDV